MSNSKYFYNIDVLRFLFAIIIVYYHILHSNIMNFVKHSSCFGDYVSLANNSPQACYVVEFFFILAGFFLFQTYIKHKDLSWFNFVKTRIARLWPVLVFTIIISVALGLMNIYAGIINSLFLQCIGVTLDYKGINWYVSPFFWASIFYFFILKSFNFKHASLIIALCVYFSLVGNINYFDGGAGRETFLVFFNGGLLRALAGIGIGYFIGLYYNYIQNLPSPSNIFTENSNAVIIKIKQSILLLLFSAVEIFCLYFLIENFIFHRFLYKNHLFLDIVFCILIFLFINKKGILSKLLDNKYIGHFGKYAYSIYVMQQISFFIMQKSLWKIPSFVNNIALCMSLSILFSLIIGIITYYIIEKPIGNYIKQKTIF